jgi:CheY-like chemotaxis protein
LDVTTATSGVEGLSESYDSNFDLILTDFNMPGLDGVNLTRSVRTQEGPNKEIPLVFISSHVEEARSKTKDLENIHFVDKLSFTKDFSNVVEKLKLA